MNPVKIVTVTMAQIPYCQPLFRFLNVSLGLIPIHNILFFDTGHRSKLRFKPRDPSHCNSSTARQTSIQNRLLKHCLESSKFQVALKKGTIDK